MSRARATRPGLPGLVEVVRQLRGSGLALPGVTERPGRERLRQAGGGPAQLAAEEVEHGVRQVELLRVLLEFVQVDASGHGEHREVADYLARRRHLDDVAQELIRSRVGALDLLEAVADADADRLLAEVGELSTRDLVAIDPAGRRAQPSLERSVDRAHLLPVRLEVEQRVERDPGRALAVVGGGDDARHGRLAGHPGQRRGGAVDGIDPCLDRREVRRQLTACSVVGVEVDGQVELLAQAGNQDACSRRAQQAGHVLDGEQLRPHVDELLGDAEVVVERVDALARIRQVTRVAEGGFGDAPLSSVASIAVRIGSALLSASKIRKMSTPVALASATNARTAASGNGA